MLVKFFLVILAALLLPATALAAPHTSTGPVPPPSVKFGHYTVVDSVVGAALGEVVIGDVPPYRWRDGCGPTAIGMIVGYYDVLYPNLVQGDPQQMISSHGLPGFPGHYEDYSLPMEVGGVIAPDKSELPLGDEHAANSVADFMHTSWSIDSMPYGASWTGMTRPAFTDYVHSVYPQLAVASAYRRVDSLSWPLVKAEIDASRPLAFAVDSSGDGRTDHMVTAIGYREVNGIPEYACWDTWSTLYIRWAQFRPLSATYPWGVDSVYSFTVGGVAADVTPPVTVAHVKRNTCFLTATDSESGVARTYYKTTGDWVEGTSFKLPKGTAYFYSIDNAGNVEAVNSYSR